MEKIRKLLGSRKFWAAVVGLAVTLVEAWWPGLPVTEEQLTQVVWMLAAYILGTGLEDGLRARGTVD
jgi:hypothetical protein